MVSGSKVVLARNIATLRLWKDVIRDTAALTKTTGDQTVAKRYVGRNVLKPGMREIKNIYWQTRKSGDLNRGYNQLRRYTSPRLPYIVGTETVYEVIQPEPEGWSFPDLGGILPEFPDIFGGIKDTLVKAAVIGGVAIGGLFLVSKLVGRGKK